MDLIYLGSAAALWGVMVLLVRGLQRLQPVREGRS